MSDVAPHCLLPTDVPSLPGPECSFYSPNPNATVLELLNRCCNGAQLHHIGNDTTEVPVEQSCISWCSYPAYAGNYTTRSRASSQWSDCIGGRGNLVIGAICQAAQSDNGQGSGSNSTTNNSNGNQTAPPSGGAMRTHPAGSGSAVLLITLAVLSLAVSTLVTA
ncbi:hypothetical protein OC846_006070 [Tilletia horrida]|uniref:Uncharacterized protein n=1 Tax=Tilletia horrida TaxID=155126 RepID=A0AAN6GJB6_9BASI|nr:hypothetical protein OC846_006070 [Tilletia horrida]KAK0560567.1 hypothetical protein OC861_006222 [Tilletia horrida]